VLIPILIAILAINILVLIHEFGHFIVAKKRGISVEVFSIGFGPKLLSFKHNNTEYKLSLILFGGYVKFAGDEVEDYGKPIPGGFFSVSPWSRILVVSAGAFLNIVFALVIYVVIFFAGKPVTVDSQNTVVGGVKQGSVAEQIGVLPGDQIIKVNAKPVSTWEDLVYAVAFSSTNDIVLEIKRDGAIITKDAKVSAEKSTGIKMLGLLCRETIIAGDVFKDSPAEKAGLKIGDGITKINGEKIFLSMRMLEVIRNNDNKEITISIMRDGTEFDIKVVPRKINGGEYATIGFALATDWEKIHPTPLDQFGKDLVRTWQTLAGLFTRSVPLKAISGPVGIIGIIGISMQVGIIPLLSIIALISLNLGVVNLLPIPVLDGGHIIFTTIEAIRKKPLSIKTILNIQNVFTFLLIAFAVYVTYNDILRMFFKR
jgi:regulator of sigma E protease